jgi:hypothetical protein
MKNSLSVLACRFYSTHSPLSQPLGFFALLAIALLERSPSNLQPHCPALFYLLSPEAVRLTGHRALQFPAMSLL